LDVGYGQVPKVDDEFGRSKSAAIVREERAFDRVNNLRQNTVVNNNQVRSAMDQPVKGGLTADLADLDDLMSKKD